MHKFCFLAKASVLVNSGKIQGGPQGPPRRPDQGAWMASTGQESTQAPQSMQMAGSIARASPCSLMALTGQVSSQAPQLMHASVML